MLRLQDLHAAVGHAGRVCHGQEAIPRSSQRHHYAGDIVLADIVAGRLLFLRERVLPGRQGGLEGMDTGRHNEVGEDQFEDVSSVRRSGVCALVPREAAEVGEEAARHEPRDE